MAEAGHESEAMTPEMEAVRTMAINVKYAEWEAGLLQGPTQLTPTIKEVFAAGWMAADDYQDEYDIAELTEMDAEDTQPLVTAWSHLLFLYLFGVVALALISMVVLVGHPGVHP
jgi:hypothetical protein